MADEIFTWLFDDQLERVTNRLNAFPAIADLNEQVKNNFASILIENSIDTIVENEAAYELVIKILNIELDLVPFRIVKNAIDISLLDLRSMKDGINYHDVWCVPSHQEFYEKKGTHLDFIQHILYKYNLAKIYPKKESLYYEEAMFILLKLKKEMSIHQICELVIDEMGRYNTVDFSSENFIGVIAMAKEIYDEINFELNDTSDS